ncbi:hypothetical protein HYFRA_00013462 [Hymenoscyphus fraxineus]|uniref:Hydrophobin n=1 Tax=Hymenoscyphus fraxineus TaxID=746836 RepID=A0A9N9PND8_9HELO|nr:hypothetical protein HYFRA_00013462 [Hymenoscyphus fraxineus]
MQIQITTLLMMISTAMASTPRLQFCNTGQQTAPEGTSCSGSVLCCTDDSQDTFFNQQITCERIFAPPSGFAHTCKNKPVGSDPNKERLSCCPAVQ